MRVAWPQIVFISVAVHVIVILGFLLPGFSFSHSVADSDKGAPMTLQLRSEANSEKAIVRSVTHHANADAVLNALPVLPTSALTASMGAPAPPTLVLKDKAAGITREAMSTAGAAGVPAGMDSRDSVVFVLDISGSMYEPYGSSTRLALGRRILDARVQDLANGTPFAVVVYGQAARGSGPLVAANAASRQAAVEFLNEEFDCGGGTNLPAGLAMAGELRARALVLVTDGDLNMNAAELLPRARDVLGNEGAETALTVVGVGPRPGTDAERLLHELVQQQGGTYQSDHDADLTAALTPKKSDVAAR